MGAARCERSDTFKACSRRDMRAWIFSCGKLSTIEFHPYNALYTQASFCEYSCPHAFPLSDRQQQYMSAHANCHSPSVGSGALAHADLTAHDSHSKQCWHCSTQHTKGRTAYKQTIKGGMGAVKALGNAGMPLTVF